MNIDLNDISDLTNELELDIDFKVEDEVLKKAGLVYLKNVVVEGVILKKSYDYKIELSVSGNFGIPCSITLETVDVPFNVEIDEYLSNLEEEFDKKLKINENTLDIFPIIWENVLVEIPMKVTSPNASLDKNLEYVANFEKEENPELAKLKELL